MTKGGEKITLDGKPKLGVMPKGQIRVKESTAFKVNLKQL